MEEKKIYTEAEIEELAERASQNAMEHFKHGLNCGECVLQGFLDLGISEYPPEIVGLVSGMGGGMGFTKHTCGAVNAGLVVISSKQGRKNPYAKETFAERVDELHHEGSGIYPRHGAYVKEFIKEYGTIECRDLCSITLLPAIPLLRFRLSAKRNAEKISVAPKFSICSRRITCTTLGIFFSSNGLRVAVTTKESS